MKGKKFIIFTNKFNNLMELKFINLIIIKKKKINLNIIKKNKLI